MKHDVSTAGALFLSEKTISVGPFQWSYRELMGSGRGRTVVLLHGLPAQGYCWRGVMPVLEQRGYRVIAPDWIGFGNSSRPDLKAFSYSPDAFVHALEELLTVLDPGKICLVVQGFVGSAGIQYALRHPEQIERLAILNAPVTAAARLPWPMRQLGLPLLGDMLVQNPLSVDQVLEGGGDSPIGNGDLAVYRYPYQMNGDAGRSLMLAVRKLSLTTATAEIEMGFFPWKKADEPFPVQLIWGERDRYLPKDMGKRFAVTYPRVEYTPIAQAGHFPQEEAPEEVAALLERFLP